MKDFYQVLGVDAYCSLNEIKDAYRKLSKKFHPDLNSDDAYFESRFREITEAYDTLSDADKRYWYDRDLRTSWPDAINSGHSRRPSAAAYQQTYRLKRRSPGLGIIVLLTLLLIVFGVYFFNYFKHSQQVATVAPETILSTPDPVFHPHKKHKRKHNIKKIASEQAAHKLDTIPSAAVRPNTLTKPVKNKPFVDSPKTTHQDNPFLYATYVKPNVTGIINMREKDDFNAAVIKTIPANSRVYVLQKGDAYYKIVYNGYSGYVPKWSLEIK